MEQAQAKRWSPSFLAQAKLQNAWPLTTPAWFLILTTAWFCFLAVFHAFPQIDVAIADIFFEQADCLPTDRPGLVCGVFLPATEPMLRIVRRILFYMPVILAVALIVVLLQNLHHHGSTYCTKRTRACGIALFALVIGPYLLVNLVIKSVSGRPRPYETDIFGGDKVFSAAGSFDGACYSNCSFISGESAGAGWVACLIVLVPARWRPLLAPPLLLVSLISPALRVAFGGHYFSDALLGYLSAIVVYVGIIAYFEMTQPLKKQSL